MKRNFAVKARNASLKRDFSRGLFLSYRSWIAGFRTEEYSAGGKRKGFKMETADGKTEILASVDIVSPLSFNKYAVNPEALELAARSLSKGIADKKIIYMDELGPVYLKSESFRNKVTEAFSSERPIFVFIREGAKTFEETLAKTDSTEFVSLSAENYGNARAKAEKWFEFWIKRGKEE